MLEFRLPRLRHFPMPSLNIAVPHLLAQDEALARIKSYIAQAKAQYSDQLSNLQVTWNGYTCALAGSGRGFSVSGNINVNPTDVTIESSLPAAAIFFKGRIESSVREVLTKVLA